MKRKVLTLLLVLCLLMQLLPTAILAEAPCTHIPEVIPAVPATCLKTGLSEGSRCALCGETLVAPTVTGSLAHEPVTDAGSSTLTTGYHCANCGVVVVPQSPIYTSTAYDEALYASEPGNWVIRDAADLMAFSMKVADGNLFAGFTVTLDADIDLAGVCWTPIGNLKNRFAGTFDGKLHTIKNMNITSALSGTKDYGLFGQTGDTACVQNVYVTGNIWQDAGELGEAYAGGIVGMNRGTIRNCGFSGSLYLRHCRYYGAVGGIAGFSNGTLYNCFATGTYVGETYKYKNSNPETAVGGIVGCLSYASKLLANCYSTANVSSRNDNGRSLSGAVVGDNSAVAQCCYSLLSAFCWGKTIDAGGTAISDAQIRGTADESWISLSVNEKNLGKVSLTEALNEWVTQNPGESCAWRYDEAKGYPVFAPCVHLDCGEGGESMLLIVEPGASVTLPTEGQLSLRPTYRFAGWFTDEACTVPVTDADCKVDCAVTFYAKWELREGGDCPTKGFTDVPKKGNWAHEGIDYCVSAKLMNGMSATTFVPAGTVTRGQLVTILYRMAGSPEAEFKGTFSDVKDGKFYSKAVEWAAANGIVNGITPTAFAPDTAITREQIATILYRYSGSPEAEGDLSAYPDGGKAGNYAKTALVWATGQGLINGVKSANGQTELQPKAIATRAQIAAIIMRFQSGAFNCT